jgi:glycine/D-amino acid oxidase-like deaminating enzyme
MDSSLSRGAKLHQPAKAASVITDATTGAITGVKILNINTGKEYTIPCTNLLICTGAWAPHTFNDLFPSTRAPISVSPLAGYSLVFRSPRYTQAHERETYGGRSHAVFTTHPVSCGFSPEIFSRHGGDIYIAGLNSWDIPLPARAEDTSRLMDKAEMDKLKAVAVRLMGRLPGGTDESTDDIVNTDDLEVVREGLCFRPVTKQGTPIVSKVAPNLLGNKAKAGSSGKGGVFVATGHGPWGISLALGTGKVVAEMIQGGRTSADVSGLGIEVPAKASL